MDQPKSNRKSTYVQRTMDMLGRLTSFADSMGIYGSLTSKLRGVLTGPMDYSLSPTPNVSTSHEVSVRVWPSSTLPTKLKRNIALRSMMNHSKSSSPTNQSSIGIDKEGLPADSMAVSSPSSFLNLDVAALKSKRSHKEQDKQVFAPVEKKCIMGCGVRYRTVVGNVVCPPCAGRRWDDPLYKGQIIVLSQGVDNRGK